MNHDDSMSQEKLPQLSAPDFDLPAPHFDEDTIAHAQPVEPLATINRWPARWATRRIMVSTAAMMVIAVAMAATLTLGALLVKLHQSNAPAPETEVTSTQAPIADETADTSTASMESGPSQKPKPRKMKLYVPNSPSKPVARRVGVIYGR